MGKRIALWDNLKLFLVFLVVVGHLTIQYFDESRIYGILTLVIYVFHMPAFIFVSGLFAKHAVSGEKPPVKRAFGFIMMYFFVRIITYLSNVIFGEHISFDIFSVKDIPWYMMAMALWYLITWAIRRIEPKYVLITSLVIGCFAGYMQGDTDFLCILRLVTFYPFFYLGYILDRERVEKVTAKTPWRIFSAVFLVAFSAVCAVTFEQSKDLFPLLSCRRQYEDLGELSDWGALLRVGYYIVTGICVFAVISLCPRKKLALSKYGRRTMQIYVWHRPILYIMENVGLLAFIYDLCPGWELIGLALMTLLTAALCFKFWGVPLDYIMNPKERKRYAAAK